MKEQIIFKPVINHYTVVCYMSRLHLNGFPLRPFSTYFDNSGYVFIYLSPFFFVVLYAYSSILFAAFISFMVFVNCLANYRLYDLDSAYCWWRKT